MPNFDKPLHIVVVGGSLAGLFISTALLHLPVKHKVTILERSPTPLLHDQGAGIVAGSDTLEWFQRHDRSPRQGELENTSVLSHERLYLDQKGNVIDREGTRQRMTSWDLTYHLGRWGFDGVWSRYLDVKGEGMEEGVSGGGKGEYAYGCNVKSIEDVREKVRIKFIKQSEGGGKSEDSINADFLVIADVPSSSLRKVVLGDEAAGKRHYAGYVAFRGTVPEAELSDAATEVFVQKFTFFHGHDPNTQILAYTIPGEAGTLEQGKRLVNWVWYWNLEEESKEYADLMTDSDGNRHRYTLPTGGKMQEGVWSHYQNLAKQHLSPQFVEVITKTRKPFVQAITDLKPPPRGTPVARLLNGKAVLVGDALSGFRPHTAASTSQAAFHALTLEKVFRSEISWEEYERKVLDFAWSWQERGVMLGQRSQFGVHPLAAQGGESQKAVDRKELHMRK